MLLGGKTYSAGEIEEVEETFSELAHRESLGSGLPEKRVSLRA